MPEHAAHAADGGGVYQLPTSPSAVHRVVKGVAALGIVCVVGVVAMVVAVVTVVAPVAVNDATVLAVRGTWPVGAVPSGEHVIATVDAPGDDMWARAVQLPQDFIMTGMTVEVVAVPGDKVQQRGRVVTVNGDVVSRNQNTNMTSSLTRQYLARCIAGSCDTQQLLVVPFDHVIGRDVATKGNA